MVALKTTVPGDVVVEDAVTEVVAVVDVVDVAVVAVVAAASVLPVLVGAEV